MHTAVEDYEVIFMDDDVSVSSLGHTCLLFLMLLPAMLSLVTGETGRMLSS